MKSSSSRYDPTVLKQPVWRLFFRCLLLAMTLPLAASGQSNYATPDTFATLAGGQSGDANGTGSAAEFFFLTARWWMAQATFMWRTPETRRSAKSRQLER